MERKRGNVRTVPDDEGRGTDAARSRAGRGGYGAPEGGGGRRRMQMCGALGEERHGGRKHKKPLFGEKRHEEQLRGSERSHAPQRSDGHSLILAG